jgi:hypothetical protein
MTLIESTYHILKDAELTTTRQSFSKNYVGKNQNWFSYQTHIGRDFSVSSAIQCLRSIRCHLERDAALNTSQRTALQTTAALLLEHLNKNHWISDVFA